MEEFQERVVEEKKQLDEKIEKLELFLGSHLPGVLSFDERDRLVAQNCAMHLYSDILGDRIAAFSA